jgi:peptidoglycan/LPS O-acetylase OafA/YrhL
MPGGLLGVDLFFVISGFLITSLLIAEVQRSGGIALVAFYGRRARRLLPALAAVLAFTVGAMALFHPGDLVRFKGDLLASVGYVTNWWFIVQHQSYFVASGRPSPFQQLWSLAVEEQFYILWPLGFLALWRTLTRARSLAGARGRTAARSLAHIGWYALGAACLSAA